MKEKYIQNFKNSKELKELKKFIDSIKNDHFNIFKIYKMITFERSKSIYLERQSIVIDELKKICKNNSFLELIKDIERTNPFKNDEEYRDEYRSERLTNDYINQLKSNFRINELERDIEANILNSSHYFKLGTPIAYEFPLIQSDYQLPIDLITYKKEKDANYLFLIELKRCNSSDKDNNQNEEMFLRAFLEITTYYSYFMHIIKNKKQKEKLLLELEKNANNKGIEIEDNFIVKKVILAPKNFFENIHDDIKELLDDYLLFSIERKPGVDLSKEIIGTNKQLFDIEMVNYE